MSELVLKVEKLEVTYQRGIGGVQGVSLEVPRGAMVTILGTNGAGKTTTLRAISGFIGLDDAEVTEGAIHYHGERIEREPPHRITARGVVLVPARSKVFENLSVADNLEAAHRPGADRRRLAARAYDFFAPLAELRRREARLLSGGERHMLALGTALLCEARLLLDVVRSLGLSPPLAV